ncbi:type II toxin-antitoxin system death-on-curing family toxin [uncultured Draconibacterium sp.]|uniref:type II toxin-antitoxin system death-on-curing family toxin n=1 Tax=uncultured Draconibacterium sp. TaxID=1573823 RepID=UPI0032601133
MIIYIPYEQALEIHKRTVEKSGGGIDTTKNPGYLEATLDFMQSDDYYPEFIDKLTYLVYSVCCNHAFDDGNKRIAVVLGLQFLSLNGYLYCIQRYLYEMENISYHLAAGLIEKDLLQQILTSIIENEEDFSEELKFEIFTAISANNLPEDE